MSLSLILAVALCLSPRWAQGGESNVNVGWFLAQLKRGGITDVSAVMSDRGKAFISCVPVAYPGVPHRFIYLIIRTCVYILITSYTFIRFVHV